MEARGEKINVSSGPSKEIAGLKKMMMKMMQGRQKRGGWGGLSRPTFRAVTFEPVLLHAR